MNDSSPEIMSIFCEALACKSADEQAAYLHGACGQNAGLRAQVEALLQAHREAGNFLHGHSAPPAVVATVDEPINERPGTVIGPYKLMEQIGEGGMGLVFVAEQQHPIRRKVALKVIKPGMDTRQVIARFEAERQALALMDHPNIAKVLDGGTTDGSRSRETSDAPGTLTSSATGRPYFVMELVKGVPITEYCDHNQIPIRERLELFLHVCTAVQHAHQKGIIHRDLKPFNVLVMSHDGTPVPKIIDFGVAKAIGHQLTEKTVYTQFAQLIGTPLYMSPEQAGESGLDVDTRSDIYSLGVLLYELLTGTTPFDRERFKEVGYDEMRRIIREEEPPKPSTRISTLGQAATIVSSQRSSDPKRLGQLVRGELDWIVMKCLEKDRNRRYETANGLAHDLERYLHDEPVQACPPSAWYRFGKFARRHKAGLATAAVLAVAGLTVVTGLVVSNVQIWQAQKLAEERAEQLRQDLENLRYANALLDRGRWFATERRWDDAHAAFTKAIDIRPDHASVLVERSNLYTQLGLWDLAASDYSREFELREPDTSLRWFQLALLNVHLGDRKAYRQLCLKMRGRFEKTPIRVFTRDLVRACVLAPDPDDDSAGLAKFAELSVAGIDPRPYDHYLAGIANYRAGRHEEAIQHLRKSVWFPAYPDFPKPILAMAHQRLGQSAQAREALEAAARVLEQCTREMYEDRGGNWVIHRGATASWPIPWRDWLEFQHYYREAKLLIDRSPPPEDPRLHALRARAFAGLRWPVQAVVEYAEVLKTWPHDPQVRFEAHVNRAQLLAHLSQWRQAAVEFAQATELKPEVPYLWSHWAVALLAAGDVDGYRQTCMAMLKLFEKTANARTASDVLHACVLRDDTLPDMAHLLPLARVAAPSWHIGTYVRAAALYRAGQYDESVRCFEAEAKVFRPCSWEWAFLAMAHFRLGRADEARHCLAEAVSWIDKANQQELDEATGTRPTWGDWADQVIFPLLVHEAEALLREAGKKPPGPTSQ